MKLILICTEGDNSEVACIQEFIRSIDLKNTSRGNGVRIEVLPIHGTHGYIHMVDAAKQEVKRFTEDPESFIEPELRDVIKGDGASEPVDGFEVVKFMVFDTDRLAESGMSLPRLQGDLRAAGFEPIVNQPNMEGFAALFFCSPDILEDVEYECIEEFLVDVARNFSESQVELADFKMPPYSKKYYMAKMWFSALFNYYPDMLERALALPCDSTRRYYTEMSRLFLYLKEALGL